MTTKIADDFASIAQYAKQHEAEKMQRIMGQPLDDAKPTEAPADIDFTGMYGYPCGYIPVSATFMEVFREWAAEQPIGKFGLPDTPKSLAHPEYPYAGTPWEWRVRTSPSELNEQVRSLMGLGRTKANG